MRHLESPAWKAVKAAVFAAAACNLLECAAAPNVHPAVFASLADAKIDGDIVEAKANSPVLSTFRFISPNTGGRLFLRLLTEFGSSQPLFPTYFVVIGREECSATAVGANVLLTAAHCIGSSNDKVLVDSTHEADIHCEPHPRYGAPAAACSDAIDGCHFDIAACWFRGDGRKSFEAISGRTDGGLPQGQIKSPMRQGCDLHLQVQPFLLLRSLGSFLPPPGSPPTSHTLMPMRT